MHIILGLLIAGGLLYFWLIGHWFARVLVFLLLTLAIGISLGANFSLSGGGGGGFVIGMVIGGVAAWFVSGLPLYYWRAQFKRLAEAQAKADADLQSRMKWDPMAGRYVITNGTN